MSITQEVFSIIESNPSVKRSLIMGLINISALTRRIKLFLPKASDEAIRAAIRRYKGENVVYSPDLFNLFKKTKITLRSNIAVAILRPGNYSLPDAFSIVKSESATTVILPENVLPRIQKSIKNSIIKLTRGLYLIVLASPPSIESTPGFVSFISELLAINNINIVEYYSCYTDTALVFSRDDAIRAYTLLDNLIKQTQQSKMLRSEA